jgi:hypothetical protein
LYQSSMVIGLLLSCVTDMGRTLNVRSVWR